MNKKLFLLTAILCTAGQNMFVCAQTLDNPHFPLPLDKENSMEYLSQGRKVTKDEPLSATGWHHHGLGQLLQNAEGLQLLVPIETGRRAVGAPGDSDYAIFGNASISLPMHGRSLEEFNRVAMDVLPVCKGVGIMNLNLNINNRTSADVGAHLINLTNNKWNHVEFDMSGLPRENVLDIRIYTDLKGRNLFEGDSLTYVIRNIRLLKVDRQAKEVGWDVMQDEIAYSMSGYLTKSDKKAILGFEANEFEVADAQTGKVVKRGKVVQEQTTIGTFRVANFSHLQREGTYVLKAGGRQTRPFRIGDDAFDNSKWRVLNYIYCQRCGVAVEGIHGMCHGDLYSLHEGRRTSYAGGWHDAGDLSQQTLQSADVAFALTEAYNNAMRRGGQETLAQRLKDEAFHGFRFILRQRLDDGWHASSMGLLHWTDGKPGTNDDIVTVRTQDNSFDNFLYAGYEAYAALSFAGEPLADSLRQAAVEDFQTARQKYDSRGFDTFQHMMEHTYNTSHSLYMAVMSWSASQLFRLTGEKDYARLAAEYMQYVLRCQEIQGVRDELRGFFYRDESRVSIVHFIHQSRDQMFAMALAELCQTQSKHADSKRWRQAARLHANYLKSLMPYTLPYGLIASGTYMTEEWKDEDGFNRLNLFAPQNAKELYEQQIREGVQLDDRHYVRRFPTWFSIFNGGEAILLSTGKSAAVLGHLLHDKQLTAIGHGQLYWTVGANPFCQSLIYGEGHNYPSMDSFSSGEITGEMPVGIRSKGNADIPYWPQTNNACYKEVWVTSAGKWLSLLSEF